MDFHMKAQGVDERRLARELIAGYLGSNELLEIAVGQAFHDSQQGKTPVEIAGLLGGTAMNLAFMVVELAHIVAKYETRDEFTVDETRRVLQSIYDDVDQFARDAGLPDIED